MDPRITFSQLRCALKCPRRHYYEYIAGLRRDDSAAALRIGSAILWPLDGWHGVTGINLAGQHLIGRLPSMRMAWLLQTFNASGNQLSEVQADIPAFDNQVALTSLNLSNNCLSERAVNQILTELVVNNGKRSPALACTVNLSGGTNAVPTGDGLTAKNTLTAAGWTVTTN